MEQTNISEPGRPDVIAVHYDDLRLLSKSLSRAGYRWVYFGKDSSQRAKTEEALGRENAGAWGDILQETAEQEKQGFLDLVSGFGREQPDQLHWWALALSYRSPLVSDLYLLYCYAKIFEDFCCPSVSRDKEHLICVIEDRWLFCHLRSTGRHQPAVRFLGHVAVRNEKIYFVIRGILARVKFFLVGLRYIVERWLGMSRNSPAVLAGGQCRYLYSWVNDCSFRSDKSFVNSSFGRLPEIIEAGGGVPVFVAQLFVPFRLKEKCRQSGSRFVFLDAYLTFFDLLKAVLTVPCFRYNPAVERANFLFQREIFQDFSRLFFPRALVHFYVFKRWVGSFRAGDGGPFMVYPFENQPWEKMLCLAAERDGRRGTLIGYQHATILSMELNYFPGRYERDSIPLPNCIVTNGECTTQLLSGERYRFVPVVNAGALRYEHILQDKKICARKEKTSGETDKKILFVMPYERILASEFMGAILASFPVGEQFKCILKFHPWSPLSSLKLSTKSFPDNIIISEDNVTELMHAADGVVSATATVWLEANICRIPAVKYYSRHILDLDLVPDRSRASGPAKCHAGNLRERILAVMAQPDLADDAAGDWSQYLSPVHEEKWQELLHLTPAMSAFTNN